MKHCNRCSFKIVIRNGATVKNLSLIMEDSSFFFSFTSPLLRCVSFYSKLQNNANQTITADMVTCDYTPPSEQCLNSHGYVMWSWVYLQFFKWIHFYWWPRCIFICYFFFTCYYILTKIFRIGDAEKRPTLTNLGTRTLNHSQSLTRHAAL